MKIKNDSDKRTERINTYMKILNSITKIVVTALIGVFAVITFTLYFMPFFCKDNFVGSNVSPKERQKVTVAINNIRKEGYAAIADRLQRKLNEGNIQFNDLKDPKIVARVFGCRPSRIIINIDTEYDELELTLIHELVHTYQLDNGLRRIWYGLATIYNKAHLNKDLENKTDSTLEKLAYKVEWTYGSIIANKNVNHTTINWFESQMAAENLK